MVRLVSAALTVGALLGLAVTGRAEVGSDTVTVVHARSGVRRVMAKLRAGKPTVIAWFGGSITEGAGASNADETSYRGLVGRWFQTTFPSAKVTNVNAAIGGTGSDLGAFRLGQDVLSHHPDLVFVEYAVNDGGAPDAMVIRSMEGIVRQIRRSAPTADICFVYTFVLGWLNEFRAGKLVHTAQLDEAVAEHYGIASVNVAAPAAAKLIAGEITGAQFSRDTVHPTDAGYRIYADALIAFLEGQRKLSPIRSRYGMPSPMRADSLEYGQMLDPSTVGTPGEGWSVVTSGPVQLFPKQLCADRPGAETTASFRGPVLGMFDVLGPDTGAFDYRIDSGAWQRMDPFDVFAKMYQRRHFRLLADGLADGPHTITFRIAAEHNQDSKGTATRIGALLVNARN